MYVSSNPQRLLKAPFVKISNVIENKYLLNKENEIIGYRSGVNFSNKIGLTSQTASVETIYSNAVSNKKRRIDINKNAIIINAPRVMVNSKNFKLLQVLDLLNNFEKYSEYDFPDALEKIKAYIRDVTLTSSEVDSIVTKYPLTAQVKFYKAGVGSAITQK
jgi:hypothetical protein